MVMGLCCNKKQHKILHQLEEWQLEEFSVLDILSIIAIKKKEIGGPYGSEGLLKYYVKLMPIQFIELWVILKFYNELLLEIFSSWVTPLNGDKDCPNF